MEKIKKIILCHIPMSICNFRCHYCYLSQRPIAYQGLQPQINFSPEEFAYALRKERIGGVAFFNFCAEGETLLTKNIDLYIKAIVEEGHYVEIVTNLTVPPMIDKILSWPKELLNHVEFKCSFHYLELLNQGKLDLFAENVKKIWESGTSANIEITPSDELIPHIDEVKDFSIKNFGALPHLTIARDDRTKGIDYLTSLPLEDYNKVWSQFKSEFWEFKKKIFGKKQTNFCYAGSWSYHLNFETGDLKQCYVGKKIGNIFINPKESLPDKPIGKCNIPHCYNGHALISLGLIPESEGPGYGDIRNRIVSPQKQWLTPQLKHFFNTKLYDSNKEKSSLNKNLFFIKEKIGGIYGKSRNLVRKVLNL